MQKLKRCKKGFTLTELAIVIAVIAILIAVLVPTFVSLINSANNSADEQTVKNMNTALSVDEAENGTPAALCGVWEVLEDAGYNPTPTPVSSDNVFYWYIAENRIVLVSNSEITYPKDYSSIAFTDDETVFLALDTDESEDVVHNYDYSKGECTICGTKTTTTAVSTADDFTDAITTTGKVALTADITLEPEGSDSSVILLTDSALTEVTIDLNGYTLESTKQVNVVNRLCTYTTVTEENFYSIYRVEYSDTYSYLLGTQYLVSYEDQPMTINITNGSVDCTYSGSNLRFEAGCTVNFTNVTFVNNTDSSSANAAIQVNLSDADAENNYTFKSCNFINTYIKFTGNSSSAYEVNTTFINCNFTAILGNGGACVSYNTYIYGTAQFDSCTFSITANGNATSAVSINASSSNVGSNTMDVTLNNVKFTGYSKYISEWSNYKPIGMLSISNTSCVNVTETGTNSYKIDSTSVNYDGSAISE